MSAELDEKIDELVDLCEFWVMNRNRGMEPKATRAAIIAVAQDIAALAKLPEPPK